MSDDEAKLVKEEVMVTTDYANEVAEWVAELRETAAACDWAKCAKALPRLRKIAKREKKDKTLWGPMLMEVISRVTSGDASVTVWTEAVEQLTAFSSWLTKNVEEEMKMLNAKISAAELRAFREKMEARDAREMTAEDREFIVDSEDEEDVEEDDDEASFVASDEEQEEEGVTLTEAEKERRAEAERKRLAAMKRMAQRLKEEARDMWDDEEEEYASRRKRRRVTVNYRQFQDEDSDSSVTNDSDASWVPDEDDE